MHVRWLERSAFRNYASLSFAAEPGLNVLFGRNAQGKTSLLEALSVLLAGRSFRTPRLGECVRWGAARAVVAGERAQGGESRQVRLTLLPDGGTKASPGLVPWARTVTQGQGVFSTTDAVAGHAPIGGGYPGAAWDVRRGEVDALDAIVAGGAA